MILAAELAVGGVWSVEKERRKNSGFLFNHMSDKFQEKQVVCFFWFSSWNHSVVPLRFF